MVRSCSFHYILDLFPVYSSNITPDNSYGMTTITILNGNICQLEGPKRVLLQLYKEYRIKHPNAWHILMYQRGKNKWDGFIKYISDSGRFKIGLLPKVYESAQALGERVKIIDTRPKLGIKPEIPRKCGELTLYPRQRESLRKLLFNRVGNRIFNICSGDLSVGFGKSLLFCAIHQAYHRKLRTILLLNDADLFNQFKREIPPLLPGEDISFIQGSSKKNRFGNFNVAMVQSISRNLRQYQYLLSTVDICLIDEADLIDNKTYKGVIEHLYNSRIRIGLSGTIYMSKLKKDLVHNMNIMSFIGPKVDTVKIVDQIKSGRATPVVVKMIQLNWPTRAATYADEYNDNITENRNAWQASWNRAMFNAKYDRFPMLIVTKFIAHCENLYKFYQAQNKRLGNKYKIAYVHHKTANRKQILEDFRTGKIDILIATTIISRGKNFPTLRYLQNTASMDSNEKAIQILGRLVRKHESKSKAYLDDLIFPGHYLARHGRHRKVYYQREKLKVIIVKRNT